MEDVEFSDYRITACVVKSLLKLDVGPINKFDVKKTAKSFVKHIKEDTSVFTSIECDGFIWPNITETPKKKSNRGRKPSQKTLEKRKRKQAGSRFKSQITFRIRVRDQIVTTKVFNTGVVVTPGIHQDRNFVLLEEALTLLSDLFTNTLNKKVHYEILDISLVYYKFKLLNTLYALDVRKNILKKTNEIVSRNSKEVRVITKEDYEETRRYKPEEVENFVQGCYLGTAKDCVSIGLCFKGKEHGKKKYETNIRLYHKGSVNITGSRKMINIEDIINWLQHYLNENKREFLLKVRCKKCNYELCDRCNEKKLCSSCEFCIKCRKYYYLK